MRYPGLFIEDNDLPTDSIFSASNISIFSWLSKTVLRWPTGFPKNKLYQYLDDTDNFEVVSDSLFHWAHEFEFSVRKEDIIARLQDRNYNYSLATITYLNRYFYECYEEFNTLKKKRKFIRSYTQEKWIYCARDNFFIPLNVWSYLHYREDGTSYRRPIWFQNHIETVREFITSHSSPQVNLLRSYNTKATDFFDFKVGKSKIEKPLFLGIELELEGATEETIKNTSKLLENHAILKRDGSLINGLEICTAPSTMDVHKEEFKQFFENIPAGLTATNTCGMHIHVDKANLSSFQMGKMVRFINNEDNAEFLTRIAGRFPNTYCKRDSRKKITSYFTSSGSFTKYEQINLSPNETIEFRLFASTIDWITFQKNIEFCKALVDYTSPCAVHSSNLKEQLQHESFERFVKTNRKFYPNLCKFISKEN